MRSRLFFTIFIIFFFCWEKWKTGQSRFSVFLGNRKRGKPGKNGTVGKYALNLTSKEWKINSYNIFLCTIPVEFDLTSFMMYFPSLISFHSNTWSWLAYGPSTLHTWNTGPKSLILLGGFRAKGLVSGDTGRGLAPLGWAYLKWKHA